MLITIIIICIVGLSYIEMREKWNAHTKPPQGWIQSKGWRIKK